MLSPLDDRYFEKVRDLHDYFSEDAQLKIKTRIEIDYFLALCEELNLKFTEDERMYIAQIYDTVEQNVIRQKEETTKHDIKAIEYYIRERFAERNIPHDQYIHFGLTSQDINSLAMSTMLDRFNQSDKIGRAHV